MTDVADAPPPDSDGRPAPWILCAAPRELDAVRAAGLGPQALGVGKVSAALGTAALLARSRVAPVILCGVCGAYDDEPAVGAVCVVRESVLADEGVALGGGRFLDAGRELGFDSAAGPWRTDPALDAMLPSAWARVRAATVSTCSGNEELAATYRAAVGAQVETMESAAVAAACARAGVGWAELRVVSNRCGPRDTAGWDLDGALAALTDALRSLRADGVLERMAASAASIRGGS